MQIKAKQTQASFRLLAAVLLLVCLTGCWDRQEIEERAVVLGIGVDEAEEGAEEHEDQVSHLRGKMPGKTQGMLRITVQIAVPGRIPLGPGGSGGGGSGGGGGGISTVWVVSSVGHTLDDAINSLQQRVAPPLFFGHLRIIVISETVARIGLENLNDFLRRNPEIRRMNWMFISKGKAMDIMKASPQLERVPTLYLMTTMDQSVKMGRFPNDFLGIFWSSSSAKGKEGYLPYAEVREGDNIGISGLAYFRGNKMVGRTNPQAIVLYMGITGMNPTGGQTYVSVPGTNEFVEYSGRSRKVLTRVDIVDDKPRIQLKIYLEGNIREKSREQITLSHDIIQSVEKEMESQAEKAYKNLIEKTQKDGADIFGFGEHVRAKKWRYWNKNIQTKENWQRMYAEIQVDVSVHVQIRRVGMKAT
ncbi:Ger(x)C family spore germination protein [Paenibacillus hexagrammi]|uniref:Ger(X)C family spore germination protein n=1 Tax=Paenibacillus hexagrammi TaxID=2908839 RepID=A0ABY3SKZ9_9BACL|nr:Ger(x)C family spore germination protein [Paenibacillus sp. YPD9-1]UJF34205.1 Ger(x)C family spore germination protein [Paenibacillus sp. YPD9-1]